MSAAKLYPLGDRAPSAGDWMARDTGERRAVRAGEWYVSGAIPAAYLAASDMSGRWMIAQPVRVRRYTVTEVID